MLVIGLNYPEHFYRGDYGNEEKDLRFLLIDNWNGGSLSGFIAQMNQNRKKPLS